MSNDTKPTRSVVMKLVLETHYIVELDEFGNSLRHRIKDLGEMARYDATCFASGEIKIDDFLRNHCEQSHITVEPVHVDTIGTA